MGFAPIDGPPVGQVGNYTTATGVSSKRQPPGDASKWSVDVLKRTPSTFSPVSLTPLPTVAPPPLAPNQGFGEISGLTDNGCKLPGWNGYGTLVFISQ